MSWVDKISYFWIEIHLWVQISLCYILVCLIFHKLHTTLCLPLLNPWVRKIPRRREWKPTPVELPGEFHRQRSLAGYSPWGHKELDNTERLTLSLSLHKTGNFTIIIIPSLLWYAWSDSFRSLMIREFRLRTFLHQGSWNLLSSCFVAHRVTWNRNSAL